MRGAALARWERGAGSEEGDRLLDDGRDALRGREVAAAVDHEEDRAGDLTVHLLAGPERDEAVFPAPDDEGRLADRGR